MKKIVCLIPPHYDFLCASIIDGLKQLDCRLYCNERINNSTEKEYTLFKDLLLRCKESDFILLFSNTNYSTRKQYIIDNFLAKKTVYIDGSDTGFPEDPSALNIFSTCFKRESYYLRFALKSIIDHKHILDSMRRLKRYYLYNRRMWPLPFAAEPFYFNYTREGVEKDINISCTLVPRGWGVRESINELVRNLNISNTVVGSITKGNAITGSDDKSKEEYFRVLARSKISIAYPGGGFDTGRFWEILASQALLFSPPIRIKMPRPFLEFKHFVPYNNLSQLKTRLLYYLDHEQERKRIADAGYRHLLKYHTTKERAKYLLDMILRRIESRA